MEPWRVSPGGQHPPTRKLRPASGADEQWPVVVGGPSAAAAPRLSPDADVPGLSVQTGETLVHNREIVERNVIQRALANHGYSRSRAASALGISRVTLYKKMKKYGLMAETVQPEAPTQTAVERRV